MAVQLELMDYRAQYLKELEDNCLSYWLKYGIDKVHGGLYSFFSEDWKLYCTDKGVWINTRAMWVFSYLCSEYGYKKEWKAAADSCKTFLEKYCIDPKDGRMYYCVTEDGKPLRKRRYYFCEIYYVCACAEYAKAFGDGSCLETARKYYTIVTELQQGIREDPYYVPPKIFPQTRDTKTLAPVMMMLCIANCMLRCDTENQEKYAHDGAKHRKEILQYFYNEEHCVLLETVSEQGDFLPQIMGGRTVIPGHGMETTWFLIENMMLTGDYSNLEKVENIFNWSVEMGWDNVHGGLRYYADALGYPCDAVDANMKLWWENCEMIIAAIYLYKATGNLKYYVWFQKANEYLFHSFRDSQNGEWFGYLNYDNTVDRPACKGNLYKGCFHIPRMLAMVERLMKHICDEQPKE